MPELRQKVKTVRPLGGGAIWAGRDRLLAGFLIAGMVLGGAGRNYPLLDMVLQALAVIVLALTFSRSDGVVWTRWAQCACGLLGAAAIIMGLQLVPLPPSVWQVLPDHDIAAQLDTAIGLAPWRPLSLTPDATLAGLLSLLPVLAALIGCLALGPEGRRGAITVLCCLALAAALLGMVQAAGPDGPLFPFATAHRGLGVGLFVNRNHQACFLLAAMPLAMAAANLAKTRQRGEGAREWRLFWMAAIVVMAMGVVATLSRTGLVLLPVVGLVVLAQGGALRDRRRQIVALLAGVGATAFLLLAPALHLTLERFSTVAEDSRLDYWRNTLFVLHDTLPLGTGIGSFRTIYATVEPLGQVQPLYVEHAHSDGLELLLEAGWPGMALIVGLLALIGAAWWRTRRDHAGDLIRLSLANAALAALGVMLACSLVDFPLRMPAIGMLAGVCLALILPSPERAVGARRRSAWRRWSAWGQAMLAAVPVAQQGMGQQLVLAGQPGAASLWAPWLAAGWSGLAVRQQAAGDRQQASASALRALRIQPMNAQAVWVLGVSRVLAGNEAGGMAVIQTAAQLGWRDVSIQNWLIDQALLHGRYDIAVHGVDAALRQGVAPKPYLTLLRAMVPNPSARPALVEALAEHPGWRGGFFNALAKDIGTQGAVIDQLLIDLARSGAGANTDETALMRWRLADAGNFADVASLWSRAGGKGLIGHPAFDLPPGGLPPAAAPLAWRAPVLPGVSVNVVQAGPGEAQAVRIGSDGIASGAVLAQTLALPAGAYTVTLQLDAGQQGAGQVPDVVMTCRAGIAAGTQDESVAALDWSRDGAGHRIARGRLTVGGSCPGQDLALTVKSSTGGQVAFSLQALRIDRAP